MKTKLTLLVALAVWLALPARSAELKPYRVGYNSWIGYISLFVAEEKGYFADEGLAVTKTSFSSPGDGLKPLLAGDLDAHFTTVDSTIIALDKAPGQLRVVYLTDTSAGADAIVATKDIATVKDMKGHTVAATIGECNHLLLVKALQSAGLTESDIKLVNMNADDAGAAFAAGKLDVAVTWEPWISQVQAAEKGHVIFSSKQVPNLILDCVTISAATADKKSAETKAFLRALNRANEFVIAHPDEAAKLNEKVLEMKAPDIESMLTKVKLYDRAGNLKELGGAAIPVAKDLAVFFHDRKATDSLVDVTKVYDASFLR
ncbi:MAG TPA: aliphatic sulfonate ABC transporter substrate-binding protein [Opitutaceae bacterium]|nr:aliphatic sulfonate ABC transporter substrate-binding protein [Opitutaceae bacterium]